MAFEAMRLHVDRSGKQPKAFMLTCGNLATDEIPAGRLLHKMLSGLRPDWEIVVLPGSVEGSVKWVQEHPHPDIIFLDIQPVSYTHLCFGFNLMEQSETTRHVE